MAALQCTIPLLTLQAFPYSLSLGDSVFATVSTTNFYGESSDSEAGNGATILQVPSAPVSLDFDADASTNAVIKVTWNNGISTGGSPILDYRIYYDQAINSFVELASGVLARSYSTQVELTAGATYKFKI
jgi:hypothetical protein